MSGLGNNEENLKYLGDVLLQVPNLKHLKLDLQNNNLGQNEDNLKHVWNSLKHLIKLQYLDLDLLSNNFGENQEVFVQLGECLKYLQQNSLKFLRLNLFWNRLEENELQSFKCLGDALKKAQNLEHLDLHISVNRQQNFEQNFKYLGESLKMKQVSLNLSLDSLGVLNKNLKVLGDGLKYIVNLKKLVLCIQANNFGFGGNKDFQYLQEVFQKLPNNIEQLELYLSMNQLGRYKDSLKYLGEGMKFLPPNLKNMILYLDDNEFENQEIQEFNEVYIKELEKFRGIQFEVAC